MKEDKDNLFGKDLGLMLEVVVTGRKAGFLKKDWAALAENLGLSRKVLDFLRKAEGKGRKGKLPIRWDVNSSGGTLKDLVAKVKAAMSCNRGIDEIIETQRSPHGPIAPLVPRIVQFVTLTPEDLELKGNTVHFGGFVSDALALRAWSLTHLEGQILKPCTLVTALSLATQIGCGLHRAEKVWLPIGHPRPGEAGAISMMRSGDGTHLILEGYGLQGLTPWNGDSMNIVFEVYEE